MEPFRQKIQCLDCEHCYMKSPLFQMLDDKELALINDTRVEVSYRKGEIIYKQGMPLTHLVTLRNGFGKIYIEGAKGRSLILNYTVPFDLNGGLGVFLDQIHHSSLVAAQDCDTCFIDIQAFREVMRSNPDFMEGYLNYYSERVRQIYQQFSILTQKNMEGRMAEAILYLQYNIPHNGYIHDISKQDLADFTAMSKESAIRVIKEFKDEGYLEVDKQNIIIKEEEILRQIAANG